MVEYTQITAQNASDLSVLMNIKRGWISKITWSPTGLRILFESGTHLPKYKPRDQPQGIEDAEAGRRGRSLLGNI